MLFLGFKVLKLLFFFGGRKLGEYTLYMLLSPFFMGGIKENKGKALKREKMSEQKKKKIER